VPAQPFKVGDRVRIVGSHPHSGEFGTIARAFDSPSAPDLKWVVSTERTWSDAAVAEREIRRAAD
jgi:hypothetical protein